MFVDQSFILLKEVEFCPESYENLQSMYKDANKRDIDIGQEEVFITENSNEALLDSCYTANVMGVD